MGQWGLGLTLVVAMLGCGASAEPGNCLEDGCDPSDVCHDDGICRPRGSDAVVLESLRIGRRALVPEFSSETRRYSLEASRLSQQLTVKATASQSFATISANGVVLKDNSTLVELEPDTTTITMLVVAAGFTTSTYEIDVSRSLIEEQQAYVKAPFTGPGQLVRGAVSIWDDTMVVGSVAGELNQDWVFTYRFVDGQWNRESVLRGPTLAGDSFGSQVAVHGDTLVVSAVREASGSRGVGGDPDDDSAPDSGAVFVYQRVGSQWVLETMIKSSNSDPGDRFGTRLALDGELMAISAPGEDSAATGVNGDESDNSDGDSGAVYLFQRTTSGWQQTHYFKASEGSLAFGEQVALSGDFLAVGELLGTVHVFGPRWKHEARIEPPFSVTPTFTPIALSGEVLAVGSFLDASNATGIGGDSTNTDAPGSGAVFTYRRNNMRWEPDDYIKSSNSEADDLFGVALGFVGDVLVVGATGEAGASAGIGGDPSNNEQPAAGAVYLFEASGDTFTETSYIKASNPETGDEFGSGIFLSPDALVIEAQGEDSAAIDVDGDQDDNASMDSGAVYIMQ